MKKVKSMSGVLVCPQPLAAAAGGQMLESGGNAIDAAVATAFAQGVVDPLMCGLGGNVRILVYRPVDRKVVYIDAGSRAGSKARADTYRYVGRDVPVGTNSVERFENYMGYKASTVPCLVRGLWDAHARYGRLPWSSLLRPAIELAANGFEVYPYLYQSWNPNRKDVVWRSRPPSQVRLNATAECARIYLRDGNVYAVGELLKQEDHAATLQRIADGGADAFHHGDVAHAIADDFDKHGGLFTLRDLEQRSSEFRQPTTGSYRGYNIVTDRAPGGGPVMIEALNILEYLDLYNLHWQSARYLDILARVFQTVFADRARYMADPAFEDVPIDRFLSKERALELSRFIHEGARSETPARGDPPSGTTHVSVFDGEGNAVSLEHSIGSSSGVVTPGLGFLYNNHMAMFDPRPGHRNCIQPGKAPRYGASPTMLFREGSLWLISGSLSQFRITAELQVLISVIDFGQDVQSAVNQPRIHPGPDPRTIYVEPDVSQKVLSELEDLGWRVEITTMTAPLCIIAVDQMKRPHAIIDPRGGGGQWPRGDTLDSWD
jgi:gamma-glutamyltranspeptidase/glutathione hydrolase